MENTELTAPIEEQQAAAPIVEEQTQQPAEQTPAEPKVDVHQQNWNNGARRIQQRQSAKARIRELEARLAKYEGKDDDYSKFQTEQLQDRIDDMRAMDADADANEFATQAQQWFGPDTEKFMQDTYRYAPYVNQNEPDLLKYAQRPFGMILLREWYDRMDNPELRQEWLGFTPVEKGLVLKNFYEQIETMVKNYGKKPEGKQRMQPKRDVPVPAGGRQSSAGVPTDDFGIALTDAFNKHRKG